MTAKCENFEQIFFISNLKVVSTMMLDFQLMNLEWRRKDLGDKMFASLILIQTLCREG
jgi:hypothetical protein